MKIAIVAPLIERVPPKQYGGTERVVGAVTEELVRRGHDVTLFASGDSQSSAKLEAIHPVSFREAYGFDTKQWFLATLLALSKVYSQAGKFDIVHDHTGTYGASFAQSVNKPIVTTLHGPLTPRAIEGYRQLTRAYLVTISHSQSRPAPDLNYIANVYNGFDMTGYPFGRRHGEYLLCVGRICPEKGTHNAVEVARKLDLPLIIAAKLEPGRNTEYFEKSVKPYLSDKIRWIGEVDENKRNKLYAGAMCFLHPIEWEEPFGLTSIEAMACGSPVVAFDRGSSREVIDHGLSGFVVKNVREMADAIKKIHTIDRADCRKHALTNFNEQRMVDGYESVYETVLEIEKAKKRRYKKIEFYPESILT